MSRSKYQEPRYAAIYQSGKTQASSQPKHSHSGSNFSKGKSDSQEAWTYDPSLSPLESITTSQWSGQSRKRQLTDSDPLSKAQQVRDVLSSHRRTTIPTKPLSLKRNALGYINKLTPQLKMRRPVSRHGRNYNDDDGSRGQQFTSDIEEVYEGSQVLENNDESLTKSLGVMGCENKDDSVSSHSSEIMYTRRLRHDTASDKKSGLSFPTKVTQDLRNRHRSNAVDLSKGQEILTSVASSSTKLGTHIATKEKERGIEKCKLQDRAETEDVRSDRTMHRKKSSFSKDVGHNSIESSKQSAKTIKVRAKVFTTTEETRSGPQGITKQKIDFHDDNGNCDDISVDIMENSKTALNLEKGKKSASFSSCRASFFSEIQSLSSDNSNSKDATKVINVDIPSRFSLGTGVTEKSQVIKTSDNLSDLTSSRTPAKKSGLLSHHDSILSSDSSDSETPHLGICRSIDDDHYDRTTQVLKSINREPLNNKEASLSEILHQRCLQLKEEEEGSDIRTSDIRHPSISSKVLSFSKANGSKRTKKTKGKSLNSTSTLGSPSSAHDFFLGSKSNASDFIVQQNKPKDFNHYERNKDSPRSSKREFSSHGLSNPIENDDVKEVSETKKSKIVLRQVTVGGDHSRTECKLLLSNKCIEVLYTLSSTQMHHKINVEDVQFFYYHESSEKDIFFVILRVRPTESNGLKSVNNYIKVIEHHWDKSLLATDGYIVFDVASGQGLHRILDWFCEAINRCFLSFELNCLTFDECKKYAKTMLSTDDIIERLQKKQRLKISNLDQTSSKFDGKNDESPNLSQITPTSDIVGTPSSSRKTRDSQRVLSKRLKGKPLNSTTTLGSLNSVHDFFPKSKNEDSDHRDRSDIKSIESYWNDNFDNSNCKESKSSSRTIESSQRSFSTHGADNPIEIDDSDEEVNEVAKFENSHIDILQVTVGADHSQTNCKLMLSKGGIQLFYTLLAEGNISMVKSHDINDEDIESCYYYLSSEQELTFAILRVKPTDSNGLRYSKSYMENLDCDEKLLATNGYIVMDLASRHDLERILDWFHEVEVLRPLGFGNNILTLDECSKYAATMLSTFDVIERTRNRKRMKKSNSIILVYPFEADEDTFELAVENLNEAKNVLEINTLHRPKTQDFRCSKLRPLENPNMLGKESDVTYQEIKTHEVKRKSRGHYLTIREEDLSRLSPGEFLNDTLVDFWMQWMIRNQDRSSSAIQVFSSHFFTTLRKEGTDAVESWTSRRNIDIFKKRLLFIPINKSLHWSLCVVVNPVKVFLGDKIVGDKSSWNDFESTAMSASIPGCILFFDSLKAHRKNEVAKHIRNWLNAEWKRLNMPVSSFDPPFNRDTFPLVSPLVPYQSNTWDCGVFVCRYAYSIFMLRHKIFRLIADDNLQNIFSEMTVNSEEFQFNMDDIKRLRKEMKTLIENLGKSYSHWKKVAQKDNTSEEPTDVNQVQGKMLNFGSELSSDYDSSENFSGNSSEDDQTFSSAKIKQEDNDS